MDSKQPLDVVDSQGRLGPRRSRSCTDVICALLFIAYMVTMIVFSIMGYVKGNIENVGQPFDSQGNPCGEAAAANYPYVYFTQPSVSGYADHSVCVASCPRSDSSANFTLECFPNRNVPDCAKAPLMTTLPLFKRVCVPLDANLSSIVTSKINSTNYQNVISDVRRAWPILLAVAGISIVVCLIYFYLIQLCATCMIFTLLILGIVSVAGLGVWLWMRQIALQQINGDPSTISHYKTVAIILWVAAGIAALLSCFLFSRIRLAAQIISSAADFIGSKISVLMVPIISLVFIFGFCAWWLSSFLMVYSVGTVVWYPGNVFGNLIWQPWAEVAVYFMLFGLLWGVSYLIANKQHTIAVLACDWYFNRFDNWDFSLFTAYGWGFWYHLGSLALGSFFVALLWLVQLILSYFYEKAKTTGQDSSFYKIALCFTTCFEKFLKYVNRNAYIEVALRDINFCAGVYKSVELFASNALRFTVLVGVLELFLFAGTMIIACGMTILGNYLLMVYNARNGGSEVFWTLGPSVAFFIEAFLIADLFNSVLETASDSMFHCYLWEESEGAAFGGSRHAPQKVKDIMDQTRDTYQQLN